METLPAKGDLIASKYLVEGTLGSGGMGTVFEVSHRVTGKHFAIKWLLPTLAAQSEGVGRFMREAQVAGRVDHPNVVEVYDFGQDGDSFYIVMELLQGEPLSQRLERLGKLPLTAACRILIPIARGLHAAHSAGVIHRDLKPDNIFLSRSPGHEETPKVLDFGISKMSNPTGEGGTHVTRAGVIIGTPRYMAPEQIRAEAVDARTDVYAMGVILYEVLTGSPPFPGDSYSDLVLRIMTEDPKPLESLVSGIPTGAVDVIRKAMSKDRNERYQNVMEFALALEPFDKTTRFATRDTRPSVPTPEPAEVNLGLQDTMPLRLPDSGQLRLRESEAAPLRLRDSTPLSTESSQLNLRASIPKQTGPRLIIGALAITAVAVAAVAYFTAGPSHGDPTRAGQDAATHKPGETETTSAAASSPPSTPTQSPSAGELPIPNTVRIGAAAPSEPARAPAESSAPETKANAGKLAAKSVQAKPGQPQTPLAEKAATSNAAAKSREPSAPVAPHASNATNRDANTGLAVPRQPIATLPPPEPGAAMPPEPSAAIPAPPEPGPATPAAEQSKVLVIAPESTPATKQQPAPGAKQEPSSAGTSQSPAEPNQDTPHRTTSLSPDDF